MYSDWYMADDDIDAHRLLVSRLSSLQSHYSSRRELWRACSSYYLDRTVSLDSLDRTGAEVYLWATKRAGNVIASVIETVHSHTVGAHPPRPQFTTVAARARLQEQVKNLQRLVWGTIEDEDIDEEVAAMTLDSLVGDCGVLRVFVEDKRPKAERVMPWRVMIEPSEYELRKPLTYYHVNYFDANALRARYPDKAHLISPGSGMLGTLHNVQYGGELVEVIEAVRMPAGKMPGRRMVVTSQGVLESEEYTYPYPPFIFLKWSLNPVSFWGIGLAEKLAGNQHDIDRKDEKIRDHEDMVAGKWVVPSGAGLKEEDFDGQARILFYNTSEGTPPPSSWYVFPSAVAPDLYASRASSVQGAYQMSGVSQLAANAEKPAGLDSAKALRAHAEITDKRFLRYYKDYQKVYVTLGKVLAYMITKDPTVRKRKTYMLDMGRHTKQVTFDDINVPDRLYKVKVRVSSFFSETPAALLQELQEHFRIGMFSREQVIRLQQTQDLAGEYDMLTAPLDLADELIESMLETGRYVPPEPFYDLELCRQRATLKYQRLAARGGERKHLKLLRRFATQCLDMVNMAQGVYPGVPQPEPNPATSPDAAAQAAAMAQGRAVQQQAMQGMGLM